MCNKMVMKSYYMGERYLETYERLTIMQDKDIIGLYFERAENAISETAEKYGALCRRIAKNILGNEADAEECVNDTYFAVWNRIPPEIPGSFSAFIAKIARNIALDRFAYNTAACRNGNLDLALEELSELLPDDTAEVDFEKGELMQTINAFLAKQKTVNRVIFVRRYFYHDSMKQIAEKTHMQENAVRTSLFRTRKKLADTLRKQGLGGIYVEKE